MHRRGEKPDLDLARRHFRREKGDITVYGTWFGRYQEPALVLVPRYRRAEDIIPCVVPLKRAWVWSESIGDPKQVADTAFDFCIALGLSPYEPANFLRIVDIVRDHLGDLLTIPPKPREYRAVADAIIVESDGKTREHEVLDDV